MTRATVFTLRAATALFAAMLLWVQAATEPARNWYKGNLHTHTANSDGDSTPNEVAAWYKANRYHFLVLSDHNFLTEVEGLNAVHAAKEKFLLIPGEEVTDSYGGKPVHVNAYNLSQLVQPARGDSLVATIQGNVDAIRAAQALPSVNHPNFKWAFGSNELLQVQNWKLFEVYNGHPTVNNWGGGGYESLDEMWDVLLTAGRRVYGIAVDDAHHFKVTGKQYSNPGRGWVAVRAPRLAAGDIAAALEAGEFYASTGVELSDIRVEGSRLLIDIKPATDTLYRTKFIGESGAVLKIVTDNTAVYEFTGTEKYVRAKVESSNGDDAWVQPVFR